MHKEFTHLTNRQINSRYKGLLTLFSAIASMIFVPIAYSAEPFKLGAEEKGYREDPMQGSATYGYPAPKMVPQAPQQARTRSFQNAHITKESIPQSVQKRVTLPPAFMGVWHVRGQRTKVEALPQFQEGAERAFAPFTDNTWQISGDENNGYTINSNDGVQTQLYIQSVQGNTAFIRYQHPIKNTMAQEAFVMTLLPGGAQFNGLTRISITKQGEPSPRAKVTYQLVGQHQR